MKNLIKTWHCIHEYKEDKIHYEISILNNPDSVDILLTNRVSNDNEQTVFSLKLKEAKELNELLNEFINRQDEEESYEK